jgi:predicted nucleic acid-binding protein
LTFVVDASFAVPACTSPDGFALLTEELIAPHLLWAEVRSTLHRSVWRGEIPADVGERALRRLEHAPVRSSQPRGFGAAVWSIADSLGWAKTYDAEYLAVAQLSAARVLTLDSRMRHAAERLGIDTADV